MKSLSFVVVLVSLTMAQTVTNYHVGGLYALSFHPDNNWDKDESFNLRAAMEVITPTWDEVNLTAKGRLVFTTPSEKSFGQLWLIHSNILGEFSIGKQPRPISAQRPNPTTCGAAFEPTAKSIMPGATMGVLYSSGFHPNLTLQFGIYDQGDHLAQYNAGVQAMVYDLKLNLAAYLSDKHRGVALSADAQMVTYTMYFSDESVSLFFEYKEMVVKPYFDMAFDRKTNTYLTTEFGFTKEFVSPIESLGWEAELTWLLGLAYNTTEEKIVFYSYLHL